MVGDCFAALAMTEWSTMKLAPPFELPDATGKTVKLSDFRGKKVVLYFYPKDNTPGCTKEACDFRDLKRKFDANETVIIGISPDSSKSHQKFQDKYKLPFLLLSDEKREVSKLYGVYKKKSFLGKSYMGIERSTFIIDEQGKLVEELRKVKVLGHGKDVLQKVSSEK